ncbi:hypothetical protein [Paenibacillus tengchongensis]|uniref:hypothetical protein n=1 Tax=Paenibacillus tengchongensis TaxID=2608684 RepID=UPI00124E148B|nr:hypothetical protein [Paenibacillus tengchongensis]
MNKTNAVLTVAFLAALLSGCSAAGNAEPSPSPAHLEPVAHREKLPQLSAESLTLTHESVDVEIPFTDQDDIDLFMKAIHSAERIEGILDTGIPDYEMVVGEADGTMHTFRLWIKENEEQAMLMDMEAPYSGYTVPEPITAKLKEVLWASPEIEHLTFETKRNADGSLVAVPAGLRNDQYSISGGTVLELNGMTYVSMQLFYGDHHMINALVAHAPASDEAEVIWSEQLNDSNNRWNNAFIGSYKPLYPLDERRLLFLEPELTADAGQFHLSVYDSGNGSIERVRENFWPLTDNYDYLYQTHWNAEKQTLFMQSYLGNVWFYNFKTGEDNVHPLKFQVIPHSTTGVPSLFLSPSFDHFAFDDESGTVGFYDSEGTRLNTVTLEGGTPSEFIKWSPKGSVAWMEQADNIDNRMLDIDIDYMKIAPERIQFYSPDGQPLGTLEAEDYVEGSSLEVAGWMDEQVAVLRTYTVYSGMPAGAEAEQTDSDKTDSDKAGSSETGTSATEPDEADVSQTGLRVKDGAYYLYNVRTKEKGDIIQTIPAGATLVKDGRQGYSETVEDNAGATVTREAIIFAAK